MRATLVLSFWGHFPSSRLAGLSIMGVEVCLDFQLLGLLECYSLELRLLEPCESARTIAHLSDTQRL